MRTTALVINGHKVELVLMAGGYGVKIYFHPDDKYVLVSGKKHHVVEPHSPEAKIVGHYVNLKYMNLSEQARIKDEFQNLVKFIFKKENPVGVNMFNRKVMRRNPMKRVTVEKYVGKFEDFSPQDQAKIITNYRDINVDYEWYEYTHEYMTTILELLGFNNVSIEFSGFSSQGDGASFTGKFVPARLSELKRRVKRVKEYAPDVPLFDYLDMKFDAEEMEDGEVKVYRLSSRYSHSNTITSDNESLKDFARSFSDFIYSQLRSEYRHLTSDEDVKDTLIANEYEFDSETLKIWG